MKHHAHLPHAYLRLLIGIPALLLVLVVIYANASSAQAQPLVDDGWNNAFYSSFEANGSVTSNGYAFGKNQTGTGPVAMIPGYPPLQLLTGYPPQPDKTSPDLDVTPPVTKPGAIPKDDPISFDVPTCTRAPFVTVGGLPRGPVKVGWTPVDGATEYVVAIAAKGLGNPPTKQLIILSSVIVRAPGANAILPLDPVDVAEVFKAQGTFVVFVNAQTRVGGICFLGRQLSTRPKPPTPTPMPVPTITPWPKDPNPGTGDRPKSGGCTLNAAGACG